MNSCSPTTNPADRYGAQYVAACMSISEKVAEKNNWLVPPSGLYGPWVSGDSPSWNGDFTLDYNQEAQYYSVFASNHGEHAAPYFAPIEDWMGAARVLAQQHAKTSKLTCAPNALHYACHLAPWGYQSHDQSTCLTSSFWLASAVFVLARGVMR